MSNAGLFTQTARLAEPMRSHGSTRAVIEQAGGIIMGGWRCSDEVAFAVLA